MVWVPYGYSVFKMKSDIYEIKLSKVGSCACMMVEAPVYHANLSSSFFADFGSCLDQFREEVSQTPRYL